MDRQVAFLAYDGALPSLESAAIVSALKARYAGIDVEEVSISEKPVGLSKSSLVLRCAGELIVVMPMPTPIPRDAWEQASLRARANWSEAPAAFARHASHLVVTSLKEVPDRLNAARVLSAVAGGLIAALPGCRALLWDSLVAHQSAFWLEASRDVFAPYPMFPYPLWVSLHPFADEEKIGVISFGLSSFIGREIELEPQSGDAAKVVHKAAGLAVYLLAHGAALKDGDTFGVDGAERILARFKTSQRVPGLAILHAVPSTPS